VNKPARHLSASWLTALSIVVGAGVIGGTLAAAGVFSQKSTSSASSSADRAASAPESAAPRQSIEPGASGRATRSAILRLLDRYQADYSSSDISGLGRLFAPNVERHGLGRKGCSTAHGRAAVLAEYASQFAKSGPVRYRLVGLRTRKIVFSTLHSARLKATYLISSSGNTGSVDFTFANDAGSWLITRIVATCRPTYVIPKAAPVPASEPVTPTGGPVVRIPKASP
jgi:hypothetical protein